VARELARQLTFPIFSKDTIKDALMATMDVPDVDTSRRIGQAAIRALIAVARDSGFGVIESVWRRTTSLADLSGLPAPIVEVFCRCDPALARSRYGRRSSKRGAGHFDEARFLDDELWTGEPAEPVRGGWPVVEVDTTGALDAMRACQRVLDAAQRLMPS